MREQDYTIHPGDHVRIRFGRHAGEIATVANITWHSNRYGSYARVHLAFEDGETDGRIIASLDNVKEADKDPPPAAHDGH